MNKKWQGFYVGDTVRPRVAKPGENDRGVVVTLNPIFVMWKRAKATYMEDPEELVLVERSK